MLHGFLTRLFGLLCGIAVKLSCRLNRITFSDKEVFDGHCDLGGNIFAFWHSRLWFATGFYVGRRRSRKMAILVSQSRDGDYGVALARYLGQHAVRGSTSRGTTAAIRGLATAVTEGYNVALTPDGPRGPAFRARSGVLRLAQFTGARIIPGSYDATRVRELKSWDGFIIIKPFGRIHVAFGEPITIPRDAGSEDIEKYRLQLEQTLHELDQRCAAELGLERPHGYPADGCLAPP